MPASSLCRLNVRAFKWAPSSSIRGNPGLHQNWFCAGPISHSFVSQHRNLITAFTYCPTTLKRRALEEDPIKGLITFIDATVAWASERHVSTDPPRSALVLFHKDLIPSKKPKDFITAVKNSPQLRNLDYVVAAVDTLGIDGLGVSVLLASESEQVVIESFRIPPTKELRVGRWHAKEKVDESEQVDFNSALAAIRGYPKIEEPTRMASELDSENKEFVFLLGDLSGLAKAASLTTEKFPTADIMGIALPPTVTVNSLFITMAHNDEIVLASSVVSFRIPRREAGPSPPTVEQHLTWFTGENEPFFAGRPSTITSFQGNLISSLDDALAMPYLLSLVRSKVSIMEHLRGTVVERPLRVVATLPRGDASPLYVNVLGGSQSRGGLALDPVTLSGFELSVGMPVTFARDSEQPLLSIERSETSVHLQIEMLPLTEYQTKNTSCKIRPWPKQKPKIPDPTHEIPDRAQEYVDYLENCGNEELEAEGLYDGLFSAATESGFLVGERGTKPWLCRVERLRTHFRMPCRTNIVEFGSVQRQPLVLKTISRQPPTLLTMSRHVEPEFDEPEPQQPKSLPSDTQPTPSPSLEKASSDSTLENTSSDLPLRHTNSDLPSNPYNPEGLPDPRWNWGESPYHGARRYSFRQRLAWLQYRRGGWRKGDFIPGGFNAFLKKNDVILHSLHLEERSQTKHLLRQLLANIKKQKLAHLGITEPEATESNRKAEEIKHKADGETVEP